MVSAARSIPSSICPTTPATSSAAPALSRTTSRRMPGSPRRTASVRRAFSSGVPPASLAVGRPLEAERRGIDDVAFDGVVGDDVEHAAAVERQLVDAVAVDDERPLGAEPLDDLRHPGRDGRVADAEQLPARAGRVGQRPEQVERGPDADLAPGRAGVAHRRVEVRREQEGEAEVAQRGAGGRGVVVDPDAERIEHVGRPGPRGHRPVAVLGDRHAGGRRDERRGGRDVERPAAVAAGPDDVDGALGRLDPDDPLAHRGREAGQLVDRLAAHPEAHQQRRQLGRRRLAVHHRAHRAACLVHRQRAAVDDRVERGLDQVAHRMPSPTVSAIPDVANDPTRRPAGTPRPRRPGAGSSRAGADPAA